MTYLLDTNAWSALIRNSHPAIVGRIAGTPVSELILSAVAWFELQYGVARAAPTRRKFFALKLAALAEEVEVAPFGPGAAQAAASVRATLAGAGTPIGAYDVQLAGHALDLDAVLVTNNTREFQRVPGLKLEDWSTLR